LTVRRRKKSGYATGHFGKWHIGLDRSNGVYGIDENDSAGNKRHSGLQYSHSSRFNR